MIHFQIESIRSGFPNNDVSLAPSALPHSLLGRDVDRGAVELDPERKQEPVQPPKLFGLTQIRNGRPPNKIGAVLDFSVTPATQKDKVSIVMATVTKS